MGVSTVQFPTSVFMSEMFSVVSINRLALNSSSGTRLIDAIRNAGGLDGCEKGLEDAAEPRIGLGGTELQEHPLSCSHRERERDVLRGRWSRASTGDLASEAVGALETVDAWVLPSRRVHQQS